MTIEPRERPAGLPHPAVIDGAFVLVPVTPAVQKVITEWSQAHHADLMERLRLLLPDVELMIEVPAWRRYVTEEELAS